jgi:hypothetical protein
MKELQLNLKELAKNKQVKDLSSHLRNNGFTRSEVRTLLDLKVDNYKGKHLVRLCELFDCTMNELFIYTGTAENHPMTKVEPVKGVDLAALLQHLSTSETTALWKAVRALIEEIIKNRK